MNILAVAVADYIGFILLVAMLISSHIRRSAQGVQFKIFTIIATMSAVACVVDFFMFYCDGKVGTIYYLINLVGNTFCFIANPVFAVGWCLYTEAKLYNSDARVKKRFKPLALPGAVLVAIALINMFVPLIFYIDDTNVYHRLPLSYVFYVVLFGYMVYSIVVVKQYEERYDKLRFFPLLLMMGPIVLGCTLQIIFYGVSLIWVSLSVGITAIYMAMQNESSYVDTLTGLYNRAYMDYVMDLYIKENKHKLGGIMIDVDYFKQINDTYGHSVGDEALIDVARIILFSKPDKTLAIRFAGDEFILVVKDCNDASMQKIISDIRDELALFNETEGRQYKLSLSMGYALFDSEKDNSDSFFKHMDDNMYEEKMKKHAAR